MVAAAADFGVDSALMSLRAAAAFDPKRTSRSGEGSRVVMPKKFKKLEDRCLIVVP